jgi:hypothetical protein
LNPAGVTSTVDVVADTDTIVQSDTSQLGATFEKRKVEDLPLLNGDVNGLAQLAPNVLPRATGVVGGGTVTVGSTVGGVRPRGNSFTIDGIDNNDAGVTGPSVTGVIQDAVEEFTLLQNNYNAEFALAPAANLIRSRNREPTNFMAGHFPTSIANTLMRVPQPKIFRMKRTFSNEPDMAEHLAGRS